MESDDVFSYRPFILGFVFDLDSDKNLRRVKEQVVRLTRSMVADTEDKVYLYHPGRPNFDRLVGESIANIANWRLKNIDLNQALPRTASLVARAPWDDRRFLFYITDRNTSTMGGPIQATCRNMVRNRDEFPFLVIGIGTVSSVIQERIATYPFASFHPFLAAEDFTKESIEVIIENS